MKEWDTVKLFLVASFILCLGGIGVYAFQVNNLKSLEKDIPLCQLKLKEIGALYAKWNTLKSEKEHDERYGLEFRSYIEKQGHKAGVEYRKLRLETQSPQPNTRLGYEDQPYTITAPRTKFHRQKIAKFIFNVENYTNRLKVTELRLDKAENNYEEWDMVLKLVERNPLEKK